MADRQEGYYWVKIVGTDKWIISEWLGRGWVLFGNRSVIIDGSFSTIYETRILMPDDDISEVRKTVNSAMDEWSKREFSKIDPLQTLGISDEEVLKLNGDLFDYTTMKIKITNALIENGFNSIGNFEEVVMGIISLFYKNEGNISEDKNQHIVFAYKNINKLIKFYLVISLTNV